MALAHESTSPNPPTHRTYLRRCCGEFITCHALGESELIQLAESVDRIELCQPAGSERVPTANLMALLDSLDALQWLDDKLVTDACALRRHLVRDIQDKRSRMRIRFGRHLLAGVAVRETLTATEQVLVLVLVPLCVLSCHWQTVF